MLPVIWALALALAQSGCAMAPETPSRWPDASGKALAEPGEGLVPLRVAVDPTLAPLARLLEPLYEAQHPGVDLVIHVGVRDGRRDSPAWLAMRLERGAEADAYLAESTHRLDDLTRRPLGRSAWLGNALAVVAPAGSGLDAGSLIARDVPVHVALDRTALGRWTRASLREAGLWGEVSLAAGNFDHGAAIVERVAYFASRPTPEHGLGIVFGSDASDRRVRVVGYLDQPRGDPTIHVVAWFTGSGEAFARWLLTSPDARQAATRAGFLVAP